MLRRLYDYFMNLAASPKAPAWLAVVSFAESSFFPVPPDVMLAPMVLAKPEHAWRNAFICTVASVLGGLMGYAIGYFLTDAAMALLVWLGQGDKMVGFKGWYDENGLAVILLKGLTPIPFKLVTITSGIAHFSLASFIFACVVTRAGRFFLVAGLLKYFGPPVREFVEKRLTLVTSIVAVAIVLLLLGLHYLHQ